MIPATIAEDVSSEAGDFGGFGRVRMGMLIQGEGGGLLDGLRGGGRSQEGSGKGGQKIENFRGADVGEWLSSLL